MDYHISSGILSSGIILSDANMYISSGGVANSTTVNHSGDMYISSGGSANSTTVNFRGGMNISNGGLQYIPQIALQTVYLDFDGELTCYNGEMLNIDSVEVKDSQLTADRIAQIVTALNTQYAEKNVVFVTECPAEGEYSTIYIGKTEAFSPYGSFAGLAETVDKGNLNRSDNAFVMLDAANSDSQIVTVISHETDHLLGTLDHGGAELEKYAWEMNINFNETSSGLQVGPSNSVHVNKGGKAVDTLLWGGTAYNDEGSRVSSGWGKMIVSADGIATGTVISNSGAVNVWGGGSALDTQIYAGGSMSVNESAYISGVVVHSGGTLDADNYASNAKIYGIIESGGAVFGDRYATMEFLPVKLENFVISGGQTTIHSATSAYNTTVDRGTLTVFNSGIASGVTVNFKGSAVISSGGTAALVKENGGAVWVSSGANVSFVSNTLSGMVFSGFRAAVTLHSATIASHATLDSEAEMYIFEGGKAFDTTLGNLCDLYIYSGGTADNVKTSEHGIIHIASGGVLNSLTLNNEGSAWLVGGTVNNGIVNNGGALYGGGSMHENPPNGGSYSSGTGIANNVTVNSGGYAEITSGSAVTVNLGGFLEAGNYLSGIVENGGYVSTTSNTRAQFVKHTFSGFVFSGIVNSKGEFTNATSATAHEGTTALSATLTLAGGLAVYSGGIASATQVDAYGKLFVYSSGLAIDTKLNSKGSLYIGSNGSAKNTIVDDSGVLMISSGGIHAGTLKITSNGSVTVSEGGIIDFTISGRSASDEVLINDLSLIQGTPNYTITVDNNQKNGKYQLAAGAADFTGTLIVKNITGAVGIVTVGAPGLGDVANNKLYTIAVEDNILTLTVAFSSSFIPPEPIEGCPVLLCSGNTLVSSGVMLTGIGVSSSYTMLVSSGGAAVSTTVLDRGNVLIYSSGGAVDTTISSGGSMTVTGGGISNTVVYGELALSGALGSTTQIGAAGSMNVEGGSIVATTVSQGGIAVAVNAQVTDLTVCAGASAAMKNGTILSSAVVTGAKATLSVSSASAAAVTLDSGAVFTASAGAAVSDVTVNAGAVFNLNEGAVYTGNITINGGSVSAKNGEFKFVLADNSPEDVFVNDISRITGTPVYSVVAAGEQNVGTYKLAGNAANFNGNFSICINGSCHDLAVGSRFVDETNNRRYTLAVTDDILSLNVRYDKVTPGLVNIYSGGEIIAGESAVSDMVLSENGNNSMYVSRGGIAELTTVSSGGIMETGSGAVISGAAILNGGSAVFAGGTTLTGKISLAGNITVSGSINAADAELIFDLTAKAAQESFIVDDLAALGAGSYTVSINANQKSGEYLIAAGASDFAGTISICLAGGVCYDPIAAGNSFRVEETNYIYGLLVRDDVLLLTVSSQTILPGNINLYNNGKLISGLDSLSDTVLVQGAVNSMAVTSDGKASNIIVSSGGIMRVSGEAENTQVTDGGLLFVSSGGSAADTLLSDGGKMHIKNGASVENVTVGSDAGLFISAGAILAGEIILGGMTFAYGQADLTDAEIILDITDRTTVSGIILSDIGLLGCENFSVTVSAEQADGSYKLAMGASEFAGSITVSTAGADLGAIAVGESFTSGGRTYTFSKQNDLLQLDIAANPAVSLTDMTGSASGLSWKSEAERFTAALSVDNFKTSISVNVSTQAVDIFGLPANDWQWRAKVSGDAVWTPGEGFSADALSDDPQMLQSDADGSADLFFARAGGIWQNDYAAQHVGCLNGWTGTQEIVELAGKNIITDVFAGSADANTLLLTDDANGDALFIDDIYSAFPEDECARLSGIKEIRAGAGNDIIDLTSQRFRAAGNGVTVFGGNGDDTIWAGSGNNILFGDAGNDRLVGFEGNDLFIGGSGDDSMQGGGGYDVFTFGGNWGNDTVEQLAGCKVTLCFEQGSAENWDADTLTYTDGINSVTVSGIGAEGITLRFGTASMPDGVFGDAASEKIFEDTQKGLLA